LLVTVNEFVPSSEKEKKGPHIYIGSENFTVLLTFLWVFRNVFAYCKAQLDTSSTASHD